METFLFVAVALIVVGGWVYTLTKKPTYASSVPSQVPPTSRPVTGGGGGGGSLVKPN